MACVLAGCSAHPSGGSPATAGPASSAPGTPRAGATGPGDRSTWMLTRGALSQVLSDPSVAARLEAARVYEILTPGQPPLTAAGAEPVVTFSSVSALRQAVDGGQLPSGTRAVLYDPEVWPYTPVSEQRNPVLAAQQAAAITRAHHLSLIVAPALDLATVQPRPGGPLWRRYLRLNLAGAMARVATCRRGPGAEPGARAADLPGVRPGRGGAGPRGQPPRHRARRAVHEPAGPGRQRPAAGLGRPGQHARPCPATG